MISARRFGAKLKSFFMRRQAEGELAREICSHLALLEDDFVARGMTRPEARMAAKRALGGVEQSKQQQRDERSFVVLEQFGRTFGSLFAR